MPPDRFAAPARLRARWGAASLRTKTLVIVAATVAALLALISIPLRIFVLDSYLQIEEQQVRVDVDRAANALADDLADLGRIAADYAARDDTYAFAAERTPAYVTQNLSDATFAGNRLSLFILADAGGRTRYGRAFDLATGTEAPLPERLREHVPAALVHDAPLARGGIIVLPDTLLLAAAHPVLTAARQGPPRGLLVVARPLDAAAVREMAAVTRLNLTVHRLDGAYPAPDVVAAREDLASLPAGVVRPLSDRTIAGYRLLTDVDGRQVAVLRVEAARPVYRQGQASVVYFTLGLLLASCISGGVALLLLERSVIARQTRLSAEVRRIGAHGNLAARVAVSGGDEIARLSDAINAMLGSLELAERERQHAYAQLKLLTDQLRRSRDILRTLFDGLDDGMALLDGGGTVLAANQRLAHMLGAEPEHLVGAPIWAEVHAPAPAIAETVRATLADGQARQQRIVHDEPGRHRALDLQVLPLLDAAGAVEQAIVHVTDVTERLRLEAAAIQSERFAAGARLAAAVAHELNTPLQSIQSCLDLVRMAQPEQRETFLTIAQEEIRRISAILRSLLAVHRPADNAPAPLQVNALVERLLLLTGGALGDRGVYVERALGADLPPVRGRADQLTQVLLNLLMNAADAMPEGGTITVRTRAIGDRGPTTNDQRPATDNQAEVDGMPTSSASSGTLAAPAAAPASFVVVEVADTGAGVPEEIRDRIFDPFFTTKPEGSGLGLAICQQIVADHGGRIAVDGAPGQGAVFTIELPAEAPEEAL
ncbi:MAG TPA: CHASE4 domain-containing protein [Roseiflexaceae bacterium]|nr:CHASE4 domain-containing protein [Roseiflexaceae bacterium]